jgi:hypothetical protein
MIRSDVVLFPVVERGAAPTATTPAEPAPPKR